MISSRYGLKLMESNSTKVIPFHSETIFALYVTRILIIVSSQIWSTSMRTKSGIWILSVRAVRSFDVTHALSPANQTWCEDPFVVVLTTVNWIVQNSPTPPCQNYCRLCTVVMRPLSMPMKWSRWALKPVYTLRKFSWVEIVSSPKLSVVSHPPLSKIKNRDSLQDV